MTRIDKRPDVHPCLSCGNPYLEGYEHRHHTDPQPGFDPMPPRPATAAEMLAIIRREYRQELPHYLHVRQVPGQTVPIGVGQYSAEAAGFASQIDALDTGELGSPSWSPPFHRRVGAVTYWEGAQTVEEGDWLIFPWAFAIELRLDRWCRAKHGNRPDLWWEHQGKPICLPMVRLSVLAEPEPTFVDLARVYQITPERVEIVLDDALGRVWGQVSKVLNQLPYAA